MYAVQFVDDNDLPEGHDWVLVQDEDANLCALFIKERAVSPTALSQAWAGYRLLTCRDELTLPEQRSAVGLVWHSA